MTRTSSQTLWLTHYLLPAIDFVGGGASSTGDVSTGSHVGSITVSLIDSGMRQVSAKEILNRWRQRAGEFPGTDVLVFSTGPRGPAAAPIEITLLAGSDDIQQLRAAVAQTSNRLNEYPGVFDVTAGSKPGKYKKLRGNVLTALQSPAEDKPPQRGFEHMITDAAKAAGEKEISIAVGQARVLRTSSNRSPKISNNSCDWFAPARQRSTQTTNQLQKSVLPLPGTTPKIRNPSPFGMQSSLLLHRHGRPERRVSAQQNRWPLRQQIRRRQRMTSSRFLPEHTQPITTATDLSTARLRSEDSSNSGNAAITDDRCP